MLHHLTTSLRQRIATAIVLLLLTSVLIPAPQYILSIALCILASLALWEGFSLLDIPKNPIFFTPAVLATCLLLFVATTINAYYLLAAFACVFFIIIALFLTLWGVFHVSLSFEKYAYLLFMLCYIVLPLQFVLLLTPAERWLVIIVTSTSDIGAFIGGKYCGKKRIWQKVSPNKTVEGAVTGFVLCVIAVSLYNTCFLWQYSLLASVSMAIVLNISSQFGDFFESALKRIHNIKDSGSILPGHGGILDRIDSLLFVIPVYFIIKILYIA